MCGIAGLLTKNGESVSPYILRKMSNAIIHRGPDSEGHWFERNIGLAHRRLSIIDLTPAGHQPMISEDHRWVLSYNGEIYNYCELRAELEAEGFWFRSKSDTEVVLYALAFWGIKALEKFNGMFALALWDRKKKELLLARDRYGIKPIYYSNQKNYFSFGSEQKAIIANPEFTKSINKEALYEYFTFQNLFTNQTLLKDINILPAGHFLILKENQNDSPRIEQYWDYQFNEPEKIKKREEYIEELDRLFRQAVNRQLISDVELGAYLSGGMDSGSISAISAKSISNLKTFTCGFDLSSASGMELAFDERINAEAMSAYFKTEHYEMVLKAGDMERSLKAVAHHLEEPRVGQSYPNYYAAKLTSKFVKVVLSGSGGDELFGGYPWRYYKASNALDFDHYIDQYYGYWQRMLTDDERKKTFNPIWNEVGDISTIDIFRNVFSNHKNQLNKPEDYINHSLYLEAKTFLHGLFVVEDKLSMAHSLENRVPFMDNDLVDFAMNCPVSLKLNNLSKNLLISEEMTGRKKSYFNKTNDGKQILREVMSRYIPKKITEAKKQGFSSPDASWFKGDSIEFVKRKLMSDQSNIYNFLDKETVKRLINEHLDGKKNRRLLIWSLLNFEQLLEDL